MEKMAFWTSVCRLCLVWWCTIVTPGGCQSETVEIVFLIGTNTPVSVPESSVGQVAVIDVTPITTLAHQTTLGHSPFFSSTHSPSISTSPPPPPPPPPSPPPVLQSSQHKLAPSTTTNKEMPDYQKSSVRVSESAPSRPPGDQPPGGPPMSSSDEYLDIIISTSVVILVLILVAAIGMVGLIALYRYRAARRRIADTGGTHNKKRCNTPWHLYYCEPVDH